MTESALPPPKKQLPLPVISDEASECLEKLRTFIYCWKYLYREELLRFYHLLVLTWSPHAARFYEAMIDWSLSDMERLLEKLGFSVKELDCYRHWALTHKTA